MADTVKYDLANDAWTDISAAGTLTNFQIQNQSNDVLLVAPRPDATEPVDVDSAIKFFQDDKLYPLTIDAGRVFARSGGRDTVRAVVVAY